MDPVVIALIRGMVMVGAVAWAVKGMAEPDLISLKHGQSLPKLESRPGLRTFA